MLINSNNGQRTFSMECDFVQSQQECVADHERILLMPQSLLALPMSEEFIIRSQFHSTMNERHKRKESAILRADLYSKLEYLT